MGGGANASMPPGAVHLPEMRARMGKKVAQLSRVMAALNNKGGETPRGGRASSSSSGANVADDLAAVADVYESEIDQILRDTASKINAFRAAVDAKTAASDVESAKRELEAKHELAMRAATRELASELERANAREAKAAEDARARAETAAKEKRALRDELERTRDDLTRRWRDAADAAVKAANDAKTLDARVSDETATTIAAATAHARELSELKAAHALAMEKLQKTHNARYDDVALAKADAAFEAAE